MSLSSGVRLAMLTVVRGEVGHALCRQGCGWPCSLSSGVRLAMFSVVRGEVGHAHCRQG